MVEFDMGVFRSGSPWTDEALVLAGWIGIFAGMFLYAILLRRPALAALTALCYLVPPLKQHMEELKSRRIAEAFLSGEMVFVIGSPDTATVEHWTELDLEKGTKTCFSRRRNDANSVYDVTVGPLDDPPKGDSP